VLLVDDSPFFRDMLSPLIKAAGYQVVSVGSAEQALAAAKSETRIDLVITDIEIYEFLRVLRRLPGGDKPKVVFCTTENDVAHIARALHAGANEYIMKPFDRDIVEAKFQEVGLI
jgi:two-component system, chemotaxis family, chemotaxis protein CheY